MPPIRTNAPSTPQPTVIPPDLIASTPATHRELADTIASANPALPTPTGTFSAPATGISPPTSSGIPTRSGAPAFEAYFTPYDAAASLELSILDNLLEARRADATTYPAADNPYKIKFAVYNLRSPAIIKRLIEAIELEVDVQVLIDGKQISAERPWNKVDETFEAAGLKVIRDDSAATIEERKEAHLVGITSNHLMHLKTRLYTYPNPATGSIEKRVFSGSMNPGDGASLNDENINLITIDSVIGSYERKIEDVLHHRRSANEWNETNPVNVLFTPNHRGTRPIEKLFDWIDQEQEAIFISVFDLKDIVDPRSSRNDKKTLVDKLVQAKNRGVKVVVISDRKKTDGRDANGNRVMMYGHYASNFWLDEDLEKEGIPVYEFTNESGQFNAMHPKAAVFGLSNMKVLTGAGNWTRGSIGSGRKRGRNEESFIFVDSKKLDNNHTGRRYLDNILYLLRHYDHQNTEHAPAADLIKELQSLNKWPTIQWSLTQSIPSGFRGRIQVSAPGHSTLEWHSHNETIPSINFPFGTKVQLKLIPDAEIEATEKTIIIRSSDDTPWLPAEFNQ